MKAICLKIERKKNLFYFHLAKRNDRQFGAIVHLKNNALRIFQELLRIVSYFCLLNIQSANFPSWFT